MVYAVRRGGIAGSPASVSSAASSSPPIAAPRLSIVVLPFTNLSDDREQQYFADGITEDLTTDLSRIAHVRDLAQYRVHLSEQTRRHEADWPRAGVRYVLEGSVRRSGSQVRVNAQLIDAETEAHLWAERFDCDMASCCRSRRDHKADRGRPEPGANRSGSRPSY